MLVAKKAQEMQEPDVRKRGAGVMERLGSRSLAVGLFVVYLVVLVWIILFKMNTSFEVFGTLRSVNLLPFAGALVVNGAPQYGEVVENVLVFVPFGLFAGMVGRGSSFWRKLLPVAGASVALELAQFVFAAGATDITDLLANTLGGALGLGLYALVRCGARLDARALSACNLIALAGTVVMLAFFGLILSVSQ